MGEDNKAERQQTERQPKELVLKNNGTNIKIISCKDPDNVKQTKKFISVPTQTITIPQKYMAAIMANKLSASLMKSLEVVK